MRSIKFMIAAAAAIFIQIPSPACTSIIVSGKATPDGRPLMWKNRDTSVPENHVQHFPSANGFYSYIGIVNSNVDEPQSVYMGTNSEGFSIMNTQSYNITSAEDKDKDDVNGIFMRKALERCVTLADFERFMDEMPRPWNVSANFGVIDAHGGAAYYEVNFTEYFKFDVNESPDGRIVRTNYSLNGRPVREGRGHVRFMEAERLAQAAPEWTPQYILSEMARSYANPLLGIDYRSGGWTSGWALEHDTIVRYKTTGSIVIQGVRPGENPSLATMWTIIGYPGTTVALPVWECAGEDGIPALLKRSENGNSELSHWGLFLKKKVYCYDLDDTAGQKYFKWSLLWNPEGTGWMQRILSFEPELLKPYMEALDGWRSEGVMSFKELSELNAESCAAVRTFYDSILNDGKNDQ